MKKRVALLFAFVLISTFPSQIKGQADLDTGLAELTRTLIQKAKLSPEARLAIVPLVDFKRQPTRFGNFIAEELITRVFDYGRFDLVERQALDKAIAELKLQMSGITDPTTAARLGKYLNAEAVLVGSWEDLGSSIKVNARIISVSLGRIVSTAGIELFKTEKIKALLEGGPLPQGTLEPQQPALPSRKVFSHEKFTMELVSVDVVGEIIRLTFLYTNREESSHSVNPAEDSNSTYLIDNLGNRYTYHDRSFRGTQTFPPQIPARFWISFGKIKPGASRVNLIIRWYSGWVTTDVVMRDISLSR